MKKIITYILTAPILFSVSLFGQMTADRGAIAYNSDMRTVIKYNDAAPKFDPAYEYDSLYEHNAAAGLSKRTETGVIKILSDNNRTPVVFYNYATSGTVIRIVNPENGKSTSALVIGKIPPSQSKSFLVMMGEFAARKLMLKDFSSAEIEYYTASNEQ